ncbi:hypothetical protein [Clostridium sp. SM-530-WT-3G]|uniref:hypothetical protein n=1 Tax=Clostridium sp. SM-530-WT-3G TaxID=2725303 RepID=UPI00145E7215|nr:hypothetical protein [Clostridium sp. SM-530-WT-3G]NME82008.1 hypothetical protein [Clostridium sp. SM-530-WT-3G]
MKLKEMTLQQVLNGLKFEYRGINTVVIGNDDNKTLYIKNITKDEFNDIVSFDINNLKSRNKRNNISFKNLRAAENIERYIIPKLEQAKNEK